jgi:hypothetical protein
MNDFETRLKKASLAPPTDALDRKVAAALAQPSRRSSILALVAVCLIVAVLLLWPAPPRRTLPSVIVVPMSPALRSVLCAEPAAAPSYFQQPRIHIEWITPQGDQTI